MQILKYIDDMTCRTILALIRIWFNCPELLVAEVFRVMSRVPFATHEQHAGDIPAPPVMREDDTFQNVSIGRSKRAFANHQVS